MPLDEASGSFPACTVLLAAEALARLSERLVPSSARAANSLALVRAGLADQTLWLGFQEGTGSLLAVAVGAAGGEPWAFPGRTLKFYYRGGGFTRLHGRVLALLRARLDGIPFERLARFVTENAAAAVRATEAPDAELRVSGAPPGPGPNDWAHPDQWREFCGFAVLEANPGETFFNFVALSGTASELRYGDLECQVSHLYLEGRARTPWLFARTAGRSTGGSTELLALLDDRDVVYGTGVRKVEQLLDELAASKTCSGVNFLNCCIPMMTGDDVQGPLARFRARTGCPVVVTDMSPLGCSLESIPAQLARELGPVRASAEPEAAARYNLAGFPHSRGLDELVALLAEAGAELNYTLLPEFELGKVHGYGRASAQALVPNHEYEPLYALLDDRGFRTLRDLAPFGWDATRAWLTALAGLLDPVVAPRLASALDAQVARLLPRWRALVERASAHRVAFVLGAGDARRLFDPGSLGGVVLPRLVAELGFAEEFLVHAAVDADERAFLTSQAEALAGGGRATITGFASPDELSAAFRSGRFALVYSNLRHDDRLTRNGLLGFAVSDVEPGLAGALRTVDRLLARAETPFYRVHAARLRGEP